MEEPCRKGYSEHRPQHIPRIIEARGHLADNPFSPQSLRLRSSEAGKRLRIGDYRAVYHVDIKKKTIIIYHIRHRRSAYKD